MTTWLLQDEFSAMRARFHRALGVSIGVHALLALGLLLAAGARTEAPRIIEVTWLEPAPMPVKAPAVAPAPAAVVATPPDAAPREPERGVAARPRPSATNGAAARERQDAGQRQARLAALAATRGSVAGAAALPAASGATRELLAGAPVAGSDLARMASATMAPVAERGRPAALVKGPAVGGAALALTRGPAPAGGGLSAAAVLSGAGSGGAGDDGGRDSVTRAAAEPREAGGTAGDILLEGPAADRQVLAQALPEYPAWARRQAVEAVVTLHFTVLPDGRVREDVRVERTGGFRDFDERAVAAFRQWRFAPLAGGDAAGQWGTITFRFRLRG